MVICAGVKYSSLKILALNGLTASRLLVTQNVRHVMMTVSLTGRLVCLICRSKVLILNGLLGTQTVHHVMMTVCLTGLLGLYLQE